MTITVWAKHGQVGGADEAEGTLFGVEDPLPGSSSEKGAEVRVSATLSEIYIYTHTHTRFFSCVFTPPVHQAGRSLTRVSLPRLCASLSQIFKLPCFQLSGLTTVNVVALIKCL